MWERGGDFKTWALKSPDSQLLTKHKVVRGPTSKSYRIPEEYSRNLLLSTFCITFRENAIMISIILQTDYVFLPECCQSHACSVISPSACCNQACPPGIKRGGCLASAEVALRDYSHSLPFVPVLSFCH